MGKNYILCIDQGTTGSRAFLLDEAGDIKGSAYSEFRQIFPKPGWVEHDAEEIWKVTVRVIRQAINRAGIGLKSICGIGITNQRETTVIWDRKTSKPIYNAIVWQCRRTADLCEELKRKGLGETFRKKTGLVIDAYFSGTKIKWLLDNVKGAREKARRGELAFGTIDSWLIWKLSGGMVHATDFTNASRTLVFNIVEKKWDEELLDILGIPESLVPEVKPSSGLFGKTACAELGSGIPIAGDAGDQQSALFGQGCFEKGLAKNTYGTGCFMLSYLGEKFVESKSGLVTTLACDEEGKPAYALEGSVFIAGAVVQWLRDQLKVINKASETEDIARSVKDTAGVYFVPAFVGLGAPYWDMSARGAIIGLTRGASRAHIIRSALESIAYQTRDLALAMEKDLGTRLKELRVDGGACQNNFLMQFQSDILGIPVNRPVKFETTGLGAGYLAGLAVGLWKDAGVISKLRKTDRVFKPKMKASQREKLYRGWTEAVKRVKTSLV
jgi:glycerol kinase